MIHIPTSAYSLLNELWKTEEGKLDSASLDCSQDDIEYLRDNEYAILVSETKTALCFLQITDYGIDYCKKEITCMFRASDEFAQYPRPGKGHPKSKANHPFRDVFICDRDRVMYTPAFRRLGSKTQVFKVGTQDNIRTRLTHTLEVSQIARTIANELKLDQDLTEAIALAHDIGHTPFGHVGERSLHQFSVDALSKVKNKANKTTFKDDNRWTDAAGFKHNHQGVRVLVHYSDDVKFSNFLLYGIREHSKRYYLVDNDIPYYNFYNEFCSYCIKDMFYPCWSFEAFVVKWADEIAQRHHDIEDAFNQKLLTSQKIVEILEKFCKNVDVSDRITDKFRKLREASLDDNRFENNLSSFVVDIYVELVLEQLRIAIIKLKGSENINSRADFIIKYTSISEQTIRDLCAFKGSDLVNADEELGNALRDAILLSSQVQRMDGKGGFIIRKILNAYVSNPQQLPDDYIKYFFTIELSKALNSKEYYQVVEFLKTELPDAPKNFRDWPSYQCRQAINLLFSEDEKSISIRDRSKVQLDGIVYIPLLRIIFDYISSLTDVSSMIEFESLY